MLIRSAFITNSSSTSFFGLGTYIDDNGGERLAEFLVDELGVERIQELYSKMDKDLDREGVIQFISSPLRVLENVLEIWARDWTREGGAKYKEIVVRSDQCGYGIYVYVDSPPIQVADDNTLFIRKPDGLRDEIARIKYLTKALYGEARIGHVEDCWYDG